MQLLKKVLIVDDDAAIRDLLVYWLEQDGYRCVAFEHPQDLLAAATEDVGAVCVDLGLGVDSGMDVLKHLRVRDSELPTVVITGDQDLASAVEAMRAGAYDYVVKPLHASRFLQAINRAVERRSLSTSVRRLKAAHGDFSGPRMMVGESSIMSELNRQIGRVADSELAVAIIGETGTGKELLARAVHDRSRRHAGPFVAINCAAIPASLQESELFGHERGAFTGATTMRRGAFELAAGGTIFLDEIGEMSLSTQASLLRVLQERSVRRVGGQAEVPLDCRIVSATNRDLEKEVSLGRFREDLYYRLVIYPIAVPALRERRDDIPLLIGHFMRSLRETLGAKVERVHPDALEALIAYDWPGNVRELQNVLSRAIVSCEGDEVGLTHLPASIRALVLPALRAVEVAAAPAEPAAPRPPTPEDIVPLVVLERREILRALTATSGNVALAARLLGLGRATLYRRIAELDGNATLIAQKDAPGAAGPLEEARPSGGSVARAASAD